jgi:predicted DNA-binding protein (MmcQ/YjbR family)
MIAAGPEKLKLETLRTMLLKMPGAIEDMPFGPAALVYKILEVKMFALVSWNEDPLRINLKCDPTYAMFLREQYAAVSPGYHMNKQHWNTIILDGSVSEDEIASMIDDSYHLVVQNMTKLEQQRLFFLSSV